MRRLLLAAVLVAGLFAAGFGAYRLSQGGLQTTADSLAGTVWPQPRELGGFMLTDHNGNAFDRERLLGRWTLVFFGYTSCPDICPTTMLTLGAVSAALDELDAAQPQVVLVSVDPKRDDAEKLREYVSYFHEDYLGVSGAEEQLFALALQIGATYEFLPEDENGNYDLAHSASIFLVDPQARAYAAFSPPLEPDLIAQKLVAINNSYEP